MLASAGIYTPELAKELSRLVGKPLKEINVAVINDASAVEPGDKRWLFDEMQSLGQLVGGEVDIVNLLALDIKTIERRLALSDVIYVSGGVTDYLMAVFERTGFRELLKGTLLNEKVYVGASAGSMVLGRRITTEGYKEIYRDGEQDFGVTEYMALVDFAIFPHLGSSIFTLNRAETIRKAAEDFKYAIYAIQDTQAVIVEGDTVSFVGGEIIKVGS